MDNPAQLIHTCDVPRLHGAGLTLGNEGRAPRPKGRGAAYERHKHEWRPSHTSEHPAAKETNLNSGGTATHRPDPHNRGASPPGGAAQWGDATKVTQEPT